MDSASQHLIARPPSVEDVDLKIGFMGAGRMAQALSLGFSHSGLVKVNNMIASDVDPKMLEAISSSVGIHVISDNKELVRGSDVVIIALKPHMVCKVLTDVASLVHANHLIISIAAGITIDQMQQVLPPSTRIIRVMPNTPALVQCSAAVFSPGIHARKEDEQLVQQLFTSIGYCISLPEKQLDVVTALSGSGPAYAFMAIEALADGGVKMGLPRDIAQRLAAQTLMGASKMVLETGLHPGALKDAVCSPGGTTIAGVHHLENAGFRGALIGAVEAGTKRAIELQKLGNQ